MDKVESNVIESLVKKKLLTLYFRGVVLYVCMYVFSVISVMCDIGMCLFLYVISVFGHFYFRYGPMIWSLGF